MEIFLFSIVLAWGLVRYGVTDLVATARGTESPRYRERRRRLELEHDRRMARMQAGPTVGQAVAGRVAQRIATPKLPKEHPGGGAARRFFSEVWDQSWNSATDRVHSHRERKVSGSLPRQKAARAARSAFSKWRHRHRDTGEPNTGQRGNDTTTAGPVHAVAEVLPQGDVDTKADPPTAPGSNLAVSFPDDTQAGVARADGTVITWPITDTDKDQDFMADQQNDTTESTREPERTPEMTEFQKSPTEDNGEPLNGEITNISSALTYTDGMREQFASAVTHADVLSAHTAQMATWARDAAVSAETSLSDITAGEVSGEAVTSLEAAREQMTLAATRVAEAEQVFANAREQFVQTAAAFDTAHSAFQRQSQVAEAYAVNPDAGSKQFNTIT